MDRLSLVAATENDKLVARYETCVIVMVSVSETMRLVGWLWNQKVLLYLDQASQVKWRRSEFGMNLFRHFNFMFTAIEKRVISMQRDTDGSQKYLCIDFKHYLRH